jgi:hypothetical protein
MRMATEVKLHAFLTSAIYSEWLASRSSRLALGEITSGTCWIGVRYTFYLLSSYLQMNCREARIMRILSVGATNFFELWHRMLWLWMRSYAHAPAAIAVQYWLEISFRNSAMNFNGALLNFVLLVRLVGPSHLSFQTAHRFCAHLWYPVDRTWFITSGCYQWHVCASSLARTAGMLCLLQNGNVEG